MVPFLHYIKKYITSRNRFYILKVNKKRSICLLLHVIEGQKKQYFPTRAKQNEKAIYQHPEVKKGDVTSSILYLLKIMPFAVCVSYEDNKT